MSTCAYTRPDVQVKSRAVEQFSLLAAVAALYRLLGLHVENYTKSGLAGHHSFISRGCISNGSTSVMDRVHVGAELEARLVFDRSAGQAADDRAATKDKIGGVDLNRVIAHADDHQLTARCEPGQQRRHGCAAGRGGDDRNCSAEFL